MINWDYILTTLQSTGEVIVDPGYLEIDLKVIYDYYKTTEEFPSKDFNDKEFKFDEFLTTYMKSTYGMDINLKYDENNWLTIWKQ